MSQKSLKDLDELISSTQKEIVLDSDIILSNGEESEYCYGIALETDGLIIDGADHTIDARNKARIFRCRAKDIKIRNVTFKGGFADDRGGAICNEGQLSIEDSTFIENTSKRYAAAIFNASEMSISGCRFDVNHATIRAGAIENKGFMTIAQSAFHKNRTDGQGGAIVSFGEMSISKSDIWRNCVGYAAGAILAQSPMMTISESKITENQSKEDANAIFASGNLKITECEVRENTSKNPGSTIYAYDADLEISNSKIIENRCGKVISAAKSDLTLSNCIAEGIIQSDRTVNIYDCILKDTGPEEEFDTTGNH